MSSPSMINTTSTASTNGATMPRTLLLSPPSISSHPEALEAILEAHDRNATDIQMLDRLALGLVSLPQSTYDTVLILADTFSQDHTSTSLLGRESVSKIAASLKAGGRLRRQNGAFEGTERTEAILAGLTADGAEMLKPAVDAEQSVSLSLGGGRERKSNAAAVPLNSTEAANTSPTVAGKRKLAVEEPSAPAGVGFVDFTDDFDAADEDDDEVFPTKEELLAGGTIDPETLLTEEDRQRPIILPEACKPNGKRRRACKDCSCGLKERLETEDAARRTAADKGLQALKLASDDLTEVDFTVKGKVGSCGNCALGDAFRCDGCPYIGLPAFKPGEEVKLLNNDVQL